MPVQKRRWKSWASKIALTRVIFKWHHGTKGVNLCICSTPLQVMGADMADHLYILLHTHQQASRPPNTLTQRTFTLIDQQAVRAPEVDVVANLHVLQILWHLAALWELGVNVLEIHLWTKGAPKVPWKSTSSHSVRLLPVPFPGVCLKGVTGADWESKRTASVADWESKRTASAALH